MGTTADIARVNVDGSVNFTHVSGDGYLAHAGALLFKAFSTPEQQDKLFADFYLEEFSDGHMSHLPSEENGDNPEQFFNLDECSYVFQNGHWFYRDWEEGGTPLKLLSREAIFANAHEYFGSDGVSAVADYFDKNERLGGGWA